MEMKNILKNKSGKKFNFNYLIEDLKKNKAFWALVVFILVLHLLTYPSVHRISDEQLYLSVASRICRLDFSDFTERIVGRVNGPLFHTVLCLTSPFHNFELDKASAVNLVIVILGAAGWYLSTSFLPEGSRRRLVLLLLANSLLWVYSLRVLIDVSTSMLLSLGLLNSYLFLEYRRKRNYYLTIVFVALASLASELAVMFVPIVFIMLLLKRDKNILDWSMLVLPFIPYGIYQLAVGFKDIWTYMWISKGGTDVPYAHLPTAAFMAGVFGPGIVSCILAWKNMSKSGKIKGFLVFSLVTYLVWEVAFDFVASLNLPRYNMTLIPFLSLIISDAYGKDWNGGNDERKDEKGRKYRYLYYLALAYSIATGFAAAYYFHVNELPIWQNQLIDITKIGLG